LVVPAAILFIAGGVCACAPLFKRVSNKINRFLSIVGFPVGITVLVVTADLALGLNFLSTIFGLNSIPVDAYPYLKYWLPVMIVLGVLLISRPIRNIRWASILSLGLGLLASVYLRLFLPEVSTLILGVVFVITALTVYLVLRFVEDIIEFIGMILAWPPIATIIGLVSLYFGILTFTAGV
jgi:hypothetical protein